MGLRKFGRWLGKFVRKSAQYGQDVTQVSMLLQGVLMRVDNAKVRIDLIMQNPSLPDDQKLVEIQQVVAGTLLAIEDTVTRVREILHNRPGV